MDEQPLQTFLRTKVSIPAVTPALVSRRRLLARLQEGLQDENCRLTLVSAPAGFGKTTLLSSWARESPHLVAWLTLEDADNDLGRFVTYIVSALRHAAPQFGEKTLELGPSPRRVRAAHLLTELINDVVNRSSAAQCERLVLVLDDYHLITSQDIHDIVTFLVDHLPSHMHLVVATRADPPLPIARLRGRAQLVEIRQADLSFTTDEVRVFFNEVMALDVPARDISTLNARTEGWAVGLQMAAQAMRGVRQYDFDQFATTFGGDHRYILDYLTEEVLQQQPPHIQTFLLQTAVLERLCASLCNAVTGRDDCQTLLERLDESNLFIVPLDDRRQWYRYHRLFADLLQARLRHTFPGEVAKLQLRAAGWYQARGDRASAIQHLLAAGALPQATELIEQEAPATLRRSEIGRFLGWVQALPSELVHARPTLTLYVAWALVLSGAPWPEVSGVLSTLQLDEEPCAIRISLLSAFDNLFHGQFLRAQALVRRALDSLPPDDAFSREMAAWILSMALTATADSEPDEEALRRLAHLASASKDILVAVSTLCGLARLQRRQGRLPEARDNYEQALALARDERGELLPVASQALIGTGSLALEWNDLDRASQQLEEGIRLVSRWREVAALQGYLDLSWLRHLQGDATAAYQLLDRAEQLAQAFDAVEWDDYYVALSRARLDVALGNLRAARRWAESRNVTAPFRADPEDFDDRVRKYEHLVLGRLLIAEDCPKEALSVLDPVLNFAREPHRTHLTIEVQILRSLALQAAGQESAALRALGDALNLSEPGGYVRTFLDEGEPIARLLRRVVQTGAMRDSARRLLKSWNEPRVSEGEHRLETEDQALVEPLSSRELEIIRLLARGLTNQEIAQRLVISLATVKWHNGNIYGKLDAGNRTEAVAIARRLGLLPS